MGQPLISLWPEQVGPGLLILQLHRTLLGERRLTPQKIVSGKVQNREIFHLNFIDACSALGWHLSPPLLKLFLIKLVYDLQRGQAGKGMIFVVVSRVFLR